MGAVPVFQTNSLFMTWALLSVCIFRSDAGGRRADDDIMLIVNIRTFEAFAGKYALVITCGCEFHAGASNYGNVPLCKEQSLGAVCDFLLLPTERCLEDHELVAQVQASMSSESKFVFRKNYAKYEFFKNPLVSLSLASSYCRWNNTTCMCTDVIRIYSPPLCT